MALKKLKDVQVNRGSFFKPAKYATTTLMVIESTDHRHNPDNEYQGKPDPRDEAVATITVFETEEQLSQGEPGEILKDAVITKKGLTDPCKEALGDAFAVSRVEKRASKNGSYFAWGDPLSDAHYELATAYLEKRDAEIAAAIDAAPDFD